MPQPLSNELRLRHINFIEEGHSTTKHRRILILTLISLFFS